VAVLTIVATLALVSRMTDSKVSDPARYVDPFVGTAATTTQTGVAGLSPASLLGQAFPGAALPFGMLQWSPDTNTDNDPVASYVFPAGESPLVGFSLLHNSGMQYRFAPFTPLSGPVTTSPAINPDRYYQHFVHRDERASPGFYQVALASGISVELTATLRGGLARLRFPKGMQPGLLLPLSDTERSGASEFRVDPTDRRIEGYVTVNDIRLYFVSQFDQPLSSFGTYEGAEVRPGVAEATGDGIGGWISFPRGQQVVDADVAVSYVSLAGASANLEAEIDGSHLTFDRATRAARAAWDTLLGRFQVGATPSSRLETFYTALYDAVLQPNLASDSDGRYMGWDGRVRRSPGGHSVYTNISSWDMARSQLAFLATFFPNQTSDMMTSVVDAYEQTGGWARRLVVGTQVEETNVGDWSLPAIAYLLGVRGFDARAALSIAVHTATDSAGNPERPGLAFYEGHGWVPDRYLFSAEDTLDYAATDFVVSRFAAALGDPASRLLASRSANWKNTFDTAASAGSASGFVWSRNQSGAFSSGWSPAAGDCYGPFEEGTSAQYSFAPLQDVAGVVSDMGGRAAAVARLDDLLRRLNDGCVSTAAYLGDEPTLYLPWLYDWVGQPSLTQAAVRRTVDELYANTPAGRPGNDDWGALSTYYLWSAIGMYPLVPGVAGVALASPSLGSVSIRLEDGATLNIRTKGSPADDQYVQRLSVDGRSYNSSWLSLNTVQNGGTLDFELGPRPSTWASNPVAAQAPPSFPAG
jgi:predicted alpha-1,2-mannosidase